MWRLSASAFETIMLRNFKKKMREANAGVKRNTGNTIKQLISLKLALVKDEALKRLKLLKKSLFSLYHSQLALDGAKVKRALLLIIYYKIPSLSVLGLGFFTTATCNPSPTVFLVWCIHNILVK